MSKKFKVIASILSAILIILLLVYLLFSSYYAKMNIKTAESTSMTSDEVYSFNMENAEAGLENSDVETIEKIEKELFDNLKEDSTEIKYNEDVFNILLIGTDEREGISGSRADCMILCSLNKNNKEITLTSIMRDSYVAIPDYGYNRINASYAFGNTKLLIDTIEQNFKINIDRYAKVDFFSFIDIVDALGGIDITLSDEEIRVLNLYLCEVNDIMGLPLNDGEIKGEAGVYHLTGKQALAYARNRYTGNSDFSRTERQRNILVAIKDKVSNSNLIELNNLLNTLLPYITTDMSQGECISLMLDSASYLNSDINSNRIPYDGAWTSETINNMSVLSLDINKNIELLHNDIYN